MKDHILEFSSTGCKISKVRGSLCVQLKDEKHLIPLDDIAGMVIVSDDVLVSTGAITALLERGVATQFCDSKYMPGGLLLPFTGHHLTRARQLSQYNLSDIQRGRFWQKVIIQKIANQIAVLKSAGKDVSLLHKFMAEVEPGDVTNREAHAARQYWLALLGDDFRRDPNLEGVNSFLNYGYAIVRSAVARYTVACGLNPAFGLFHQNLANPFCLIDDLMEPFRPIADLMASRLAEDAGLSTENKRRLVSILELPVQFKRENRPLRNAIQAYCQSFAAAVSANDWKQFDTKVSFIDE